MDRELRVLTIAGVMADWRIATGGAPYLSLSNQVYRRCEVRLWGSYYQSSNAPMSIINRAAQHFEPSE